MRKLKKLINSWWSMKKLEELINSLMSMNTPFHIYYGQYDIKSFYPRSILTDTYNQHLKENNERLDGDVFYNPLFVSYLRARKQLRDCKELDQNDNITSYHGGFIEAYKRGFHG